MLELIANNTKATNPNKFGMVPLKTPPSKSIKCKRMEPWPVFFGNTLSKSIKCKRTNFGLKCIGFALHGFINKQTNNDH